MASPIISSLEKAVPVAPKPIEVMTEKPMSARCELVGEREGGRTSSLRVVHNCPDAAEWSSRCDQRSARLKRRRVPWLGLRPELECHPAYSGGLSVSKSCRYPDMVSWFLADEPDKACTFNALRYCGPRSPHKLPIHRGDGEVPDDGHVKPRAVPAARAVCICDVETDVEKADPLIRRDLLVGPTDETRWLSKPADRRQGAHAVAVGEVIWRSVQNGRPHQTSKLPGEPGAPPIGEANVGPSYGRSDRT